MISLPPTMIKMHKGMNEKEVAKMIKEETAARVKMLRQDLKLMQQQIVNKNLSLPPSNHLSTQLTGQADSSNYNSCIEASTSSSACDRSATSTAASPSSSISAHFIAPPPPAAGTQEEKKKKRGRKPKANGEATVRSRSASSTSKERSKMKQIDLNLQNG